MSTIFAKIIKKQIPADIVFEDEEVLAFKDVNPQAPVHILVIPKQEIPGLSSAKQQHQAILGKLLLTARKVAEAQKLVKGYRIVINDGEQGGQTVHHIHVHVLGGRSLGWPPG